MKFVNIGFNNMINSDRVIAVISADSAPSKRLIQEARDNGRVIDCTSGKKTRCIIVMDSDHIILSAIQNETVSVRLNGVDDQTEAEA